MLQLASDVSLRPAILSDLPQLLQVCIQTANAGQGATHLHNLQDLYGEIYVAPYVIHEPGFAFSLIAGDEVVGYLLGVLDTGKFEDKLDSAYWPATKAKYNSITEDLTPHDLSLIKELGKQGFSQPKLISKYPSHLHIDIIQAHQGLGYGKSMIVHLLNELKSAGSAGVHLHMAARNERAKGFYQKLGFSEVSTDGDETIMGLIF